jgi:WD40 repeat protein
VRIWEAAGKPVRALEGHTAPVTAAVYSPDGKLIASGSADNTIHLWDAATAKDLFTLKGHTAPITVLAFTPDSKHLVSTAGDDRALRVWDCATGKQTLDTKDAGPTGTAPALAATPDDKQAAVWVAPAQLEFYDLMSGKMADSWAVDDGLKRVTSLTFSGDGSAAALGTSDGKVRLYDLAGHKQTLPGGDLQAHDAKVVDLTLSTNRKVLATVDDQGLMKTWDVTNAKELQTLKAFTDPNQRAAAFVLSPDGTRLATAGLDSVVRLWDAANGKELRQWNFAVSGEPGRAFVRALAFTPDGKQIVTGNANTTMYLLDCP